MSKGIFAIPIIPKIKKAAIKFGTTPIKDNLMFLNKIKNIANIPIITKPRVKICDLNKLWSKLLNKISTPANLYSSSFSPILFVKSYLICFISSFLLSPSSESLILKLILASESATEIYGSTISFLIESGIFE